MKFEFVFILVLQAHLCSHFLGIGILSNSFHLRSCCNHLQSNQGLDFYQSQPLVKNCQICITPNYSNSDLFLEPAKALADL